MTSAPVVAVAVGAPSADLDVLLEAIGRQVTVVDPVDFQGSPDWLLEFRTPYPPVAGTPRVVFLADLQDLSAAEGAAAVVAGDADLLQQVAADLPAFRLWPSPLEHGDLRPFAPYPRERIRRARGLPAAAVGEVTAAGCRWDGREVPDSLADTVLTTAAAVIADRSSLFRALAVAAPVVTDPDAAVGCGAEPGRHVLASADPQERRRLAADLATDMARAARLSWAGRMLFEERSVSHLVAKIDRAVTTGRGPAGRADQVLAELGTPADAPIRSRARARFDLPD